MGKKSSSVAAAAASQLDVLGINDCVEAMRVALRGDVPIHFVGPPGIGKSAIVEKISTEMGLSLETLLLSQVDPTDVGGFPVATNGCLDRLPLGAIKAACDSPVVLFLDEISCAAPAVQGAALQLVYNRRAGDRKLHPGTRIVAASNPPDQAAGGWELAPPLISRLLQIRMRPTMQEVQSYFYNLGAAGSTLRMLGVDWAATLECAPDLLQIDPPPGAAAAGHQWGTPRSWERALTFCANVVDGGGKEDGPIFIAGLAGNVGEDQAAAFTAIRKIREQLPGVKEIVEKPDKAKIPQNVDVGIAALGVIGQVGTINPCAAWVYAARLQSQELSTACLSILGQFKISDRKNDRWHAEADKAQIQMLKALGNCMKK